MTPKNLVIGGYGPEKSAHGEGLAAFRDHLIGATNGEIGIEVVWNIMDQGRPNTDLFEEVAAGEMFFCYFSSSYLGDRVAELNVLETPFLFGDLDMAHRSLDGDLGERLREAVRANTPFVPLGFWDNGFRHMTNRLRPIRKPEDCAGMTVRMQPNEIHEELIRCWGAEPIAVELSEAVRIISSLQVDAQENPLANTIAYGVDKVHPYVTMTGHLYGARGLFANASIYDSLDPELRDIVDDGVALAVARQRESAETLERRLRREMSQRGIEFIDLTTEERASFERASQPAIDLARSLVPAALYELVA
ncbi:MAG TPA: TRAP transporter substrate-binding protein [Acidimicrobiia bacterium]|nr:TRAP transporter substrate-binding protein [Acidimicrobiia bacterium]